MIIDRSVAVDGNLSPSAVNLLHQIPAESLFYGQQQLRHPDALYSFSLTRVAEAYSQVASAYLQKTEEYRSPAAAGFDLVDLLKCQENFLRALQEHLDDCWLILKTLVNPVAARKHEVFADKYVIKNKLPGAKSFQDAIAGYKMSLRIANKLKHQQCRLRGIAIFPPGRAHIGYFLEAPDSQGRIGPCLDTHPDQGAFSFARDLGWHLFNVYSCSRKLADAVQKALNS